MRQLIRLLVVLGLVLSAASLAPLATAGADPAAGTAAKQATTSGPATILDTRPDARSHSGRADFNFHADQPSQLFTCQLAGPGHNGDRAIGCSRAAVPSKPQQSIGAKGYTRLQPGNYTFSVFAHGSSGVGPTTVYSWRVDNCSTLASLCRVVTRSGRHYLPASGASFNNPLAGHTSQRRNLSKVIATINSMPGYAVAHSSICGTLAQRPGTIRVSLYSVTDGAFADAMVAAARRCISVQILMNNHLSAGNTHAIRVMQHALGARTFTGRRMKQNFAHRCSFGCRGSGVLHSKFYLFDSTIAGTSFNRVHNTVMVGSSNMTANAAKVQWNDLYTVRNRPDLRGQYIRQFNSMARDNGFKRVAGVQHAGAYQTTFWPYKRGAQDPYLTALRSVRCTGATGGSGTHGRTVVYINMHAWFEARGLSMANQVRRLYNQGCYVHVLYGFMSFGVFKKLRKGTGGRMTVRRTLFSHDGRTGYVYTHFKNIAISGHIGGDTNARASYTGSDNFTNYGTHFDEVMMRIATVSAFNQYRRQFNYMSRRKSSAVYANFSEPSGGGRAPKAVVTGGGTAPEGFTGFTGRESAPKGTQTIQSSAVGVDSRGVMRVLD